jgi:hypothetical protein
LPTLVIKNSGNTIQDKDRLSNETCKMAAMARLRDEIICCLPGAEFLPPTIVDNKAIVGLKAKPKTWIEEGKTFLKRIAWTSPPSGPAAMKLFSACNASVAAGK